MNFPIIGLILLAFGFFGGMWAWVSIRSNNGTRTKGYVLILSIPCMFYGLIKVLPWLADN